MTDRIEIAKSFAKSIKNNKIKKVVLFGSVARGEDNAESDIDILIVSSFREDIFDLIYNKVVEILMKDGEHISAHIISEERFNTKKHYSFLSNVLEEGVLIG
ncbi:MAG: nucleotidyltransferase domain-containing protein [Methanobrevibacter sp.]|nr:nucleotidyltransferase domain-containing protein [Methanobrevibacter sp.]